MQALWNWILNHIQQLSWILGFAIIVTLLVMLDVNLSPGHTNEEKHRYMRRGSIAMIILIIIGMGMMMAIYWFTQ